MEKCKYCEAQLEENSTVCPGCGKDNAEETAAETAAEAIPAEEVAEAAPAGETAAEETAEVAAEEPAAAEASEEAVAEEAKPEEKKVTPTKMALVIGAIVVVAAIIVALLAGGMQPEAPAEETETLPAVEVTEPVIPTVPANGNPDDETCKGTYTVTDAEVKAAADTVVATLGEHKLTNGQLQAFYWMQVQNFLSSEYGSYMMYYGLLDYTQSLDTQVCAMAETRTWQQFFLKEALTTWRNYCVLSDKAKEAEMELSAEEKEYLEKFEENMAEAAAYYGLESAEDFMGEMLGAGASVADYRYFQELLGYGNLYYDAEYAKIDPTLEEMEAYFAEHEEDLAANGITKEGDLVDVRHVLFTPEGGTTDENGVTTYSDAEWAACEAKAQDVLNAWTKKGNFTEESFAELAATYSQDPGSQSNGGLYERVYQGQMVEEFDAWCFDANRKPGHYGMVKTTYGYHLMFFVDKTPIWQDYVDQILVGEKANEMMENLVKDYPMEVDYSAISLGYVNLAG